MSPRVLGHLLPGDIVLRWEEGHILAIGSLLYFSPLFRLIEMDGGGAMASQAALIAGVVDERGGGG